MGSKLNGWIGVKNGMPMAIRFESAYESQLERNNLDINLFSGLFTALTSCAEEGMSVKLNNIVLLEYVNLNERLYELGITPSLLSYGSSYKHSSCAQDYDFQGIGISRVLGKNDDFLLMENDEVNNLTNLFCEDNEIVRGNMYEEVSDLTLTGSFNELYNKLLNVERVGNSRFSSKPLMIYANVFDNNGENKSLGFENHLGYDLELFLEENRDIFSEYFNDINNRESFFSLLKAIRDMRRDWYFQRDNVNPEKFTLLTFKDDRNYYQNIEYIKDDENVEFTGLLLKMQQRDDGALIRDVLKNSYFETKRLMSDYKSGVNMSLVEARMDKNLTF